MGKIIFINRYFYPDHSATSQLLTDLAFALAREGRDVRVITSRQAYDNPLSELPAVESVNGVSIIRVWTSRFGRRRLWGRAVDYVTFYISAAWRLAMTAAQDDVIIAKTDPPLISVMAAAVVKLRKATLINWIQDLFPEVASALGINGINVLAPVLLKLRNASLRTAKINVVLGNRMAERIIAQGISSERIRVIHNWADGKDIKPLTRGDNQLREEWGLRNGFVVGYSGNMGRAHEFRTIIDAAELLKDEAGIVFLFVGDGAYRAWLEREVAKRGLGNVIFRPYQERGRLTQSLGVADVHLISLQPSLEGLIVPSKFYGIAAAGRAVLYIGDPDGEIPRIVRREKCGLTVSPGDSETVANCLRQWSLNRELVSEMGKNARTAFERRFDKEQALAAWREVLQEAGIRASLHRAVV